MPKNIVLILLVLAALVTGPRAARADCSSTFWECAKVAYKDPSFWGWYAAQIDCELDYVECIRISIIGQ